MNIEDVIEQSDLFFDRNLRTNLILPVSSFEQIKIQPNETVVNSAINQKLKHLHDNFLYLYKNSRVASNVIPVESLAIGGVSAYESSTKYKFSWFTGASSSDFTRLSFYPIYGENQIQEIAMCKNLEKYQYTIFTTTGRDIVAYNSDNDQTSLTLVLSTNELYPGSNVRWKNIVDVEFGSQNQLYILDEGSNKLARYDASGFTTSDVIIENLLVYKDSIGGYGGYNDPLLFNGPRALTVSMQNIYVLDSNNSCIKRYDENLNWLTTYRLFRDFLSAYPVDISSDQSGNIYVLSENGFVLKYDHDILTKEIIDMRELSATQMDYKKIVMSPSDANIAYIVTSSGITKTLLTSFTDAIGPYLFSKFDINTPEIIQSFAALDDGESDKVVVCSNYNNRSIFQLYKDNINLYDVLSINDFDIYTFEEMKINYEEYVQNWVFNKTLSKMLINHMRLRDNIVGKFLTKKDSTETLAFEGTRYLMPEEISTILFQQDVSFFVGLNEIFQNSVVNRCLKKIFDIQNNLLNILQVDNLELADKNVPILI
jgi:hypothetical protein